MTRPTRTPRGRAHASPGTPRPEAPTEESRSTDADGVTLHARCWLNPRVPPDPPVVVVHGLGVASRMCQPVARRLAAEHHVYAPDLPGFGQSEADGVRDVDGHADALTAWMRATGLEAGVLVGVSFGCQVAAAVAHRHAEHCRLLVLGSPTVDESRRTWRQQLPRWQAEQATHSLRMHGLQIGDYARAGLGRVARTFSAAMRDRLEDRLPDITHPALVCWGTRDPLLSRSWAARLAAAAPRGRLAVLPGGTHALSHDHPLPFARVITAFVDEHAPRTD